VRNLLALILLYVVRFSLWFRYRVTIKGLENLNRSTLNKPGGAVFLPNHPTVFVDPTLITLAVWRKYPIRPMVVEYMYYTPIIHSVMKFMNALPIPNFVNSSNSLKKKKADRVVETVIEDLKKGQNFLIYPAGKVKHQAREIIGGASAVHRIIQAVPEANVVLVRITGLWGSRFSRALTGKTPFMFATIWQGVKIVLKNLLFFTPRREVTIEFMPAPDDFPYRASRMELNKYLEDWYNRPDGLTETKLDHPGESLYLVSYSMWKEELPSIPSLDSKDAQVESSQIPADIQQKVKKKLSEISQIPIEQIQPEMNLSSDVGLDSLDNAEILAFLDDEFDVAGVPVEELTTVGKVMALAANQVAFGEQVEEEQQDLSKWRQFKSQKAMTVAPGKTIAEVFLNNCARMRGFIACGDMKAGVLTYDQAKLRVLLLAEYIRHLPGEYIGILLPSSVAAYLTVLACHLAGKVPLMVNWTVGPRHLESVIALSNVKVVLSSWAFLDRLENVNLTGIEECILTLEDVRRELTFVDQLKAYYRSKLGTASLLKIFNIENLSEHSPAVLLFTSGTESMPKGVPLTHHNILSNQREAAQIVDIHEDDILLGILPPFHAFGFTVSGLLPLVTGFRAAYYPDPTDGKGVAKSIERWSATVICGAPTFLKGVFKNAKNQQLKTLRICVTGAEKAPKELFDLVQQHSSASVIEGYGITECSPILTINMTGDPKRGVGKPLPEVNMCIVDLETHQPLPQGKQGLILVRGPNIFSGYLNKGLASPFLSVKGQNWYSTGDLGYFDSENNLIISGRLKRFVKVGGEMVSLTALEDALQQSMGHQTQAEGPILAISAKEEAGEKTKIYLFTTLPMTIEEANKALRRAGFSNLIKITKVYQLPEIPIMGTGKIHYRALENQLTALMTKEELKA
jgi:long-chain-fatty-acid--[acyl-carrier-protein] ligase